MLSRFAVEPMPANPRNPDSTRAPKSSPDDDELTSLQTTRGIQRDLKKIAAIEEIGLRELTNRVLLDFIRGYAGGALAAAFRSTKVKKP